MHAMRTRLPCAATMRLMESTGNDFGSPNGGAGLGSWCVEPGIALAIYLPRMVVALSRLIAPPQRAPAPQIAAARGPHAAADNADHDQLPLAA